MKGYIAGNIRFSRGLVRHQAEKGTKIPPSIAGGGVLLPWLWCGEGSEVVRLGLDVTESDLFRMLRGRHALFLAGVGCLYHPSGKRLTGAVEAFLRNGVTASDPGTQKTALAGAVVRFRFLYEKTPSTAVRGFVLKFCG